jgi:nitrogen regulatory protein P-II 2
MQLHALKQVTIIVEKILQDQILPKLLELGATGYTAIDCSGCGHRGVRSGEFGSNLQITLICPEDVSHKILTFVAQTYFENYATIAWESDVQVVRGARYVK